jgi:hydrogenase maturation protease
MDESAGNSLNTRILCLGNDVLCDDAVGLDIADELAGLDLHSVEITKSCESGLRLIDHLVDVDRLIIIDAIQTGKGAPGSVYSFHRHDFDTLPGASPHYTGVFEALDLAHHVGLKVTDDVVIIAIETADCLTIGGEMDARVRGAIPRVVDDVLQRVCANA